MSGALIYHGTPLTPRPALADILPGRASCVSFWRPDDVEAVEAVCPQIMFRQRRVLGMALGREGRAGMVHPRGLDAVLRLVGATIVHAGTLGGDPGCARRAVPAQRQLAADLALRGSRSPALAHGRADRAATPPVREILPGLPGLDRAGRRVPGWMRGVVSPDGRGCEGARQSLARPSHDARDVGRPRVSLHQRRQHVAGAERTSL